MGLDINENPNQIVEIDLDALETAVRLISYLDTTNAAYEDKKAIDRLGIALCLARYGCCPVKL